MVTTVTVKGGFWEQYGTTFTLLNGKNSSKRRAAQALAQRGSLAIRELMETLNGVAPGQAASKTLKRVAASSELGGVRTIETETIISRNSAAADVTAITADILTLSSRTYDPTPVPNKDLNPLGTR